MNEEQKPILPEDPSEAEFGRGAPGNNHYGVQLAQAIDVNPPDAQIPSNVDVELNIEQLEAAKHQEDDTNLKTTDGYVIDESGRIDNFPVEPEMYVEDK